MMSMSCDAAFTNSSTRSRLATGWKQVVLSQMESQSTGHDRECWIEAAFHVN